MLETAGATCGGLVTKSCPTLATPQTAAYQAAATAESLQSCPTLSDPIDGSPPGCRRIFQARVHRILQAKILDPIDSSPPGCRRILQARVHRILQAKILEWVAISFSKGQHIVMQIKAIDMCWAGGMEQSHVLKPHLSQKKIKREFCNLLARCLRARCKLTTLCQSLSRVQLFATPWTVSRQAPCPWDSPGENTGMGCHALFQGIFPTQEQNLHLLHYTLRHSKC